MAQSYLPRHVDSWIADAMNSYPIVLIDGPRAVGKTTTAEQVAESIIRLPQDLPLIAADAASVLSELARPVLIDEWQLADTELLWTLKRLVDADPTPGQFMLTGSVEPATYGPTYPLTGRAGRIVMHPMTRAELLGRGDQPTFLERLITRKTELVPQVAGAEPLDLDALFATGFPAARNQSDPSMFLEGYAALVSQRAGEEGRDATRLAKALAVLGVLTGQAVPDQRIWDSADINKATWKAYDDLLARVHLSVPLPAYSSNALKRLTTYPKRFLADTALSLALARVSRGDLRRDPAMAGRYVESYVVQQLRPQAQVLGARLSHVRTSGGDHEVDLLVELGSSRVGFGMKAGTRPTATDAKHLVWLDREIDGGLGASIVAHTGTDTYPIGDDIWAVPITALS